ncbi:hypothetical protein KR018_012257 [Drosophila ironensis]|nr:hypothetical protein KR018_012257 [Drosophila ironensis]
MSTSLAQQLRKLAAPETSLPLADARSRASILFDRKEAATKDRRAIYEIGRVGLQELAELNPAFKDFEMTLFDEATLTLERSVELPEVNKMLDAAIAKFLRLLSPYLSLRPAHMAFEWLLRRFQVHEYNRSAVMALILPYHETIIFVQVLQTMRLRAADSDWAWLKSLQRPGVPLSKTAIINRAASNPSFLKFVCQSTQKAVKELGPRAHQLQAQINFYATVVVGALQSARPIQDWHITTILESLLKGLVSDTVDFMAAAYVIVAQLVSRTKLQGKVCNALLERVASCPFERLHNESLLLLVCIYSKQQAAVPLFKPQTVLNLVGQKWLIPALAGLANGNIAIQSICMPLLTGAVTGIREDDSTSKTYKQFLDSLLSEVPLATPSAQQLINCFLDTFVPEKADAPEPMDTYSDSNEDTIVIDSDDELETEKTSFQTWYSSYLEKLERRYPEAFDLSVKEALRTKATSSNRQKALKMALGFRLNTTDDKAKRAYEKLYHYSPDWRLNAVLKLLENLKVSKKRERSVKLLQECLLDRINDDSGAIVAALLGLSTEQILEFVEPKQLAPTLCRLLQRAQSEKDSQWHPVAPLAVRHLTTDIVSGEYDPNLILLALMPLLFPGEAFTEQEHRALVVLLESEFSGKVPFLRELKVQSEFNEFKANEQRQSFLDVIAGNKQELFSQERALLQSIDDHGGEAYLQEASQVTHLLLLLTAYAKRELQPSDSLHMLERTAALSRRFEFRNLKSHRNVQDFIPLQLYLDFLLTLVKNTKWTSLSTTPWDQVTDELRLGLRLLELHCTQVFSERLDLGAERAEWSRSLQQCLSTMLPEAQDRLELLSNFYVFERLPELWSRNSDYTIFRLQGFLVLEAVLANQKSKVECSLEHVLRVANACGSPLQALRVQAINTLQLLSTRKLVSHVEQLVRSLLQRRSELGMDHEQYALILYTILEPENLTAKEKMVLSKLKKAVLALASDSAQPPIFTAALLASLKHVNNEEFLGDLLPLGLEALQKIAASGKEQQLLQLPWPHSDIFKSVIERFEGEVAFNVLLKNPKAWELLTASFKHYNVYIQLEQKLQPLPCVLLNSLTPETFERLQTKDKVTLIKLIVEAATRSDNDSIFLASHRLLKRCRLECQPLLPILGEMAASKRDPPSPTLAKRRSLTVVKQQLDLTSSTWKYGMTLLELLENKKLLVGAELLISPLFELLEACLELEEHSAAEYPKQLILSNLLHACQTAQASGVQLTRALPESSFRIDLVVLGLRNTRNPQTQQHALLFLTHCASLYPEQVLHKIVEIFTFVGSTVARHDDAFSLQIIHNVVESVIPILLSKAGQKENLVIPVLKVFADICSDVPMHRRLPLYATLFRVLDPKEHLWKFLCIVFESQVLLQQSAQKVSADKSRLDFARELILMFEDPSVGLQTGIHLLDYLAHLPANKEAAKSKKSSSDLICEQQLFDVHSRSFKELRHYKYLIIDFLSDITSSSEWRTKMVRPDPTELMAYYQGFILSTLSYVGLLNGEVEASAGTPILEKFWRVLANHAHDVLDNAIGLLAPEYFLSVITDLMQHDLVHVRIKVLELLATKLGPTNEYFKTSPAKDFGVLFAPLEAIINGILDCAANSAQQAQLQQTALHALQLLVQRHGREFIEECRSMLATLTKITKRRANVPKAVVGNVVLTLVEICASIKAHALAQLPKFAPQLTEMLKEQVHQMVTSKNGPDYLCSTLVAALHKLFKALPLFLGPYLVDIIGALVRLSVQLDSPRLLQDKRTQLLKTRLLDVWSAVAQDVEVRILVPSCAKVYSCLLEQQAYDELGQLMQQLLLKGIRHNAAAQLQPVQESLSELFLQALEFRLYVRERGLERQQVTAVEAAIAETFVTWILKLSEASFRPMYSRVHKWALESNEKETQLTYFLLTNRIAEALKSLFVLFASDFVEDASRLLHEHNTVRPDFTPGDQDDDVELLSAILGTLHNVFLHCSEDFINEHRFDALMAPLVNQLENELVLGSEQLQQALTNCTAQLAVATNDVMWKQLNSQVLLKTRTQTPEVRILAFNNCVAIARKLGESFAPLLPETVPFIAELLEDEHHKVEKNTRSAVQELEAILGEPVQKYL